ncbi:MAG: MauE/DoxX family redox-associated membrane protein [Puia sp.]|nr:MauE/DoxX family redox-associated membrane protein [Puia sp.]
MITQRITASIAYLFALLFLYTGFSKIIDLTVFKEELSLSEFIRPFATFVVVVLPPIEIVSAIMLIIPRSRKKGFVVSLALMVLFTLYVSANLLLNNHALCGCGGGVERLSPSQHLGLNGILIGLAVLGLYLSRHQHSNIPRIIAKNI